MAVAFFKDANAERKYFELTLSPNEERYQEYVEGTAEEYEESLEEYKKRLKDDSPGI